MRYVKNNFFDGDRQDSFDILTGAWVAKRGGIPPLTDTRPLLMRAVSYRLSNIDDRADDQMPYVLAFALAMLFCAITLPRTSGQPAQLLSVFKLMSGLSITSFIFLWFALALFAGSYIWGNVSFLLLPVT